MLQLSQPYTPVVTPPALKPKDIQIWHADMQTLNAEPDWLNDHERERYTGYRSPLMAQRFIGTRSLLRYLLGQHAGIAPDAVELTITAHGKPVMLGESPLQFNLSHSGNYLLIAIRRDAPVGIDIEKARSNLSYERIAMRVFDKNIAEQFSRPDATLEEFLITWTALEARQKCLGQGIFGERVDALTAHRTWEVDDEHTAALAWPIGQPPEAVHQLQLVG